MQVSDARRQRSLEEESLKLKKLLAEALLHNEFASGKLLISDRAYVSFGLDKTLCESLR